MLCVLQLAIAVPNNNNNNKSNKIKQANFSHDILAQLVNIVSMDHGLMVFVDVYKVQCLIK